MRKQVERVHKVCLKTMLHKCWRGCAEKGTFLSTVGGNATSTAAMENSVEIYLKTGNRTAI